MTCYAVLWLPKIMHGEILPVGNHYIHDNVDISDYDSPLKVRVQLMDNRDVEVCIYDQINNTPLHFITLKYEDHSCNGTIMYSYEEKIFSGEAGFKFTKDSFPKAIYHLIKAFYHQHDFHDEKCDTILRPYTSDHKIDIHKEDNEALLHYLECYEEMLKNTVIYVQMMLSTMRRKTDNWKINDRIFKVLPELCLRARGYEVYMSTLYHSRYNTLCKKEVAYFNNSIKRLRQRAFNIENALRYLRTVEYEFDVMYQQKNTAAILTAANDIMQGTSNQANASMIAITNSAKSSTRWAIFGIIVSLIFGAGSIIYSGVSAKKSSNELIEVRTELNLSIDTLSNIIYEISTQVEAYENVASGIDAINKQLNLLRNVDSQLKEIRQSPSRRE